jgi:hypothetical protein
MTRSILPLPFSLTPLQGESYWVSIDLAGIDHLSYSDLPLFSSGAGLQAIRAVRTYTRQFFDRFLKAERIEILGGAAAGFPEVTIRRLPDDRKQ